VSRVVYPLYELRRLLRNRRFVVFPLAFPLGLFYAIAGPNRHVRDLEHTGVSGPLYFMVGLAAFGAMNAVLGAGARIAAERAIGWNRQLRLTPLPPRAYVGAKVASGYLMALVTIAALFAAGASLGVGMTACRWSLMTAMLLIGLLPFAALGILVGHLVSADSAGPAIGGATALFGLLGGVWFPISRHGVLHLVAQALPSYWLVQAGRIAVGAHGWTVTGWLVVAAWTIALTAAAARAYRRDTGRA
jgi:ABC-2 type transport system permease protein